MVKKLIIFLIPFLLFCKDISSLILIESKLFPKIAEINLNKTPKIAIVYDDKTKKIASKMHKLIKNSSMIKNLDLSYDSYIFVKKIEKKELKELIKNKKIVFTIYPEDINNAMFSIYIGIKIYPYLNAKLIKQAKIRINPILLKVSKIHEE